MKPFNHTWTAKVLLAAAAFCRDGSCESRRNNSHAHAYALTDHRRRRPALARRQPVLDTRLSLALRSRGGAAAAADDAANSDDEMHRLRKQWSAVAPCVPSVAWPRDARIRPDSDDDEEGSRRSAPTKALILMDGFSPYHGRYLDRAARRLYGAATIRVLSDFMTRYLLRVEGRTDHLSSRSPDASDPREVEAWKGLLPKSTEICGIYCESDSGLDDAERLGVALGMCPRRHDGRNEARRNKYRMNEAVAECGLETVKQKSCGSLEEAEEFATSLGLKEESNDAMVVAKPLRGVASDDVHLCSDLSSLRRAFRKIYGSPVFGSSTSSKHEAVLVQEFARGTEYAVDVVCRDGERKVAALWRYDKRAVNGAPFVYFATRLVSAADDEGKSDGKEVERAVCDYVFKALDALGVRWGMSHVEVIAQTIAAEDDAPETIRVRLVEVNCRQHNTDFRPLTNAVVGYNALDMVLAAYLGENSKDESQHEYPIETEHLRLKWDDLPTLPTTLAHGAIVHFVSHVQGKISRIRYDILNEIEELDSVMDIEVYPQFLEVGNEIEKTVDIRSDTGWAHLMNDDEEQFDRDYERLVELMKDMFEVE